MIREILISPYHLIVATIILWLIVFQTFYRLLNFNDTNWKRLEYVWLFAGFLGLINLVVENKKEYNFNSSERIKNYIVHTTEEIKKSLSEERTCFKYTKSEFSTSNLEEKQKERDRFCSWSKIYAVTFDTITKTPRKHFKILKYDSFKTNEISYDVKDINQLIKIVNSEIDEYNLYRNEYDSNDWKTFSKTFGVLLLIIAFAIRLSIATKNIIASKNKNVA